MEATNARVANASDEVWNENICGFGVSEQLQVVNKRIDLVNQQKEPVEFTEAFEATA